MSTPDENADLLTTLGLAAGWIIRAVEEYGVHKDAPDGPQFLAASQMVLMRIGAEYVRLGVAREGETCVDVTRRLVQDAISKRAS
jgi:hypothetical protein